VTRAFSSVTWEEALRGFILHKKATRSPNTAAWYETYAKNLIAWAKEQGISLDQFTKRHLDQYLVFRAEKGVAPTSLHHDALIATVFTEWCSRNDLLDRDPLAEYKVRNAPKTYKYMPTPENVKALLQGILDFYNVDKRPDARFTPGPRRSFHRDRNYAIELVKLDSACRIGEVFSFRLDDYQMGERGRELIIREAKGREPRILPVSPECAAAVDQWLKVRKRVMSNIPAEEDEGWLFISETGGKVGRGNYLRVIKQVCEFTNLPKSINNHSQRRFSINGMAEAGGLLFAQRMAGHKDPKTTLIYTEINSNFLRQKHEEVGIVRGLLISNRTIKRKRLV